MAHSDIIDSPEFASSSNNVDELNDLLNIERVKNKLIADDLNCELWVYDIASETFTQIRGFDGKYGQKNTVTENYRQTVKAQGVIHPEDIAEFDAFCDSMNSGKPGFTHDLRAIADGYSFMWFRYTGMTVFGHDGKPYKVVGKTLDVSEEKTVSADTVKKANSDPLTNLANKTGTKMLVEKLLSVSDKNVGSILLIFDIDGFNEINKKWG